MHLHFSDGIKVRRCCMITFMFVTLSRHLEEDTAWSYFSQHRRAELREGENVRQGTL